MRIGEKMRLESLGFFKRSDGQQMLANSGLAGGERFFHQD